MRILIVGDNLTDYLAKCHEAFRDGLRLAYSVQSCGKGYPGFEPGIRSYAEIMRRLYPNEPPDLILTDFNLSRRPEEWTFPFEGLEKVNIPKAIVLGDYWNITEGAPQEFLDFLERYNIERVLCYFPGAVHYFSQSRLAERFSLLLPCVNPSIFHDWQQEKQYDIGFLAAGTTEYSDFYPERYAIHQKLLGRKDLRYLWAPHPGWGEHRQEHHLVGSGFSRAINSCRIFITTAGKTCHPNPKYMEILASNSLLLAEEPDGADAVGLVDGQNYVSITAENVLEKVDEALKNPERMERITRAGYELAMQRHTHYVRALEFGRIPGQAHVSRPEPALFFPGGLDLPAELIEDENEPQPLLLPVGLTELPMSSSPQYTLYRFVRALRPRRVLEIGSQHGASAVAMALAMRDNQMPVDVTCIDPFLPSGDNDGLPTLQNWYNNVLSSGFINRIKLLMTTSDQALPRLNTRFDFVVIDGSHEYKDVRYDFDTVLPLVTPGGYIWLHDFMTYESVRAACLEIAQKHDLPFAVNRVQRNYRGDLCGWMVARNIPQHSLHKLPDGKQVLFLVDSLMGHATLHARGYALCAPLEKRGWQVKVLDVRQAPEKEVLAAAQETGLVYLLKVADLGLIQKLKTSGAKLVFDLADALWKEPHRSAGWGDLDKILALADAITSDNPYVAEYGRRFGKPISIVPMVTQIERFDLEYGKTQPGREFIRIGWVGSQGTAGALENIRPVLERLAERHPNLDLRVLGARAESLPQFRGLRVSTLESYNEEEMVREVLQMDVGIHPVPLDDEDYVARGGMKAFLYMSGGVPPVCQALGEAADLIRDGETGMLARSEAEWLQKLDVLVSSSETRRRIGQAARAAVRKDHSLESVSSRLEEVFLSMTHVIPPKKELLKAFVNKPAPSARRPRILLMADVPNWIFERHCLAIQHFLSDEFEFNIAYQGQVYNEYDYDLIYPLEWNLIPPEQIHTPAKYVTGIRSHISWANLDFDRFIQFLQNYYSGIHVVSRRLEAIFKPRLPQIAYVTHGVDTQFFTPSTRADQSGKRLRLGWAGNRKSPMKGFAEYIQPLGEIPGVELIFCGYSDRMLTTQEMREFYNAIDVYVCSSSLEGNNNPLLEAASMARAIITTDNGTVPEYLRNGESAIIVERTPTQFVQAVERLRDDPSRRVALGQAARAAVLRTFDWNDRAQDYRRFFRRSLEEATNPMVNSSFSSPIKGPQTEKERALAEQVTQLLKEADQAFSNGEMTHALDLMRDALGLAPDDEALILAYGNLLLRSGDAEAARREFVKAVTLAPQSIPARLDLAAVLIFMQRYEDAQKAVERILLQDEKQADAWKLLGRIQAELKEPLDSCMAYLRAAEYRPDDLEAWLILGKIYFELGDWVSARAAYRRALQLDAFQVVAREALRQIDEATRPPAPPPVGKEYPVIAFAILTHNALDYTKKALASIARYTPVSYEVYVLDNASSDETPAWLEAQTDPHLHFELSRENSGVSGGRNKLIQMILPNVAESTALVFMDNDIELFPGWIDPYLDLVRVRPDLGIAGVAGYWMTITAEGRELRGPAGRHAEAVDVASGGFACWIPASVIREMGFFDENLGKFWHEDDDFSVRVQALDYGVYAVPQAAVVHHAHKSGTTNVEVAHRGSARNQQYLVQKWRTLGFLNAQGDVQRGVLVQRETAERAGISAIFPKSDTNAALTTSVIGAKTKPRIVIDGFIFQWQAGQPLGISRVWTNLIPELVAALPEMEVILLRRKGFNSGLQGITEIEIPAHQMGDVQVLDRDDAMLTRVCKEIGADVFLSTYYTRAPGIPNLLLLYDMIPEIFGWNLTHPEWLSKQRAIALAGGFLTISHSTRNDLLRLYHVPGDKVAVAYTGVSKMFKPAPQSEVDAFRKKYKVNRPYFLLVGKRESYKNPIPFYQAFMQLNDPDLQVLAVGGAPQLNDEEIKAISPNRIMVLPTIPDEEMRAAYSAAEGLVYPSVYEGFGLPVLEALACGCPVIIGRNSSLPEVGGEAACYVNPLAPQEILVALKEVRKPTVRARMRTRGLDQARHFTWTDMGRVFAERIRAQLETAPDKRAGAEMSDKPPQFPRRKTDYLVTAIVSTYKSEEFMRECLTDLVNQSLGERLEIIVVDAASPQKEGLIVQEFQKRHRNITSLRTGERIGVYAAWNMAIQMASGKYITPFSTNDRLRRDAHEIMARALDENPGIALVYGDTYFTPQPHETFEQHTRTGAMLWPAYSYEDLLLNNRVGPHPMWRRSLHAELGYFDEKFIALGDQEFWLRIGERHPLLHLPLFTGLYWKTADSLSENLHTSEVETQAARTPYLDRYRGPILLLWEKADQLIKRAAQSIELGRMDEALKKLEQAVTAAPAFMPAWFSYGRLFAYQRRHKEAVEALRRGAALDPAHWTLRLMLVDELAAAGDPGQAAAELAQILDIYPGYAPALERKASLAPFAGTHSASPKTMSSERQAAKPQAADTLARLLDANDLTEALQRYEAALDEPLLKLVWENAAAARADNQPELADGLDALAEYVQNHLTQKQPSTDINILVDVVVPVYGQPDLLRRCVESVLATTENAHLTLVDDSSPGDEIQSLFENWRGNPHITLHRNPQNVGFLETCLNGAALGNAPFILFLNSDTEALKKGWLEALIPKDAKTAITGPKLVYPDDAPGISAGKVQHAGVARGDDGVPYHPFLGWDASAPEVNQARSVNAVTGACLLVRRTVWDELGGWDLRFGRGVYEDVDLCWQARRKGYGVRYEPAAFLIHRSSASEKVGGRHLLYDKKDENLQSLLNKWQGLQSDEDIFYGKETLKRWREARLQLQSIIQQIEKGNNGKARRALQDLADKNPDQPDVNLALAHILAVDGMHRRSAEIYERLLTRFPEYWEARLHLAEEWEAAGEPQKAASVLKDILIVFPQDPAVQAFERRLVDKLRAAQRPAPAEVLRRLLDAEDIHQALREQAADLDENLLALVERDAANARQAGEEDLAAGLDGLAAYISNALQSRTAKPETVKGVINSEEPQDAALYIVLQRATAQAYAVDIVIPIYGRGDLLRQCVDSLRATVKNTHLILVDDCTPGDMITNFFMEMRGQPDVTLARMKQNQGFIETTRAGAELGSAPFILYLNSDTQALEAGWLEHMIPTEDDVAVVGARLLFPAQAARMVARRIQHAGISVRHEPKNTRIYNPFQGHAADYAEANVPRYLNAVSGACLLVRRTVWQELGGWDNRFGKGVFEDVDFCWRVRQYGLRIQYQPAAWLYHYMSASLSTDGKHSLHRHSEENLEILLEKWKDVPGDDELFFGKKDTRCFPKALEDLRSAIREADEGRILRAASMAKKVTRQCPKFGIAHFWCAETLSKLEKYPEALEHLNTLLELEPFNWAGRFLRVQIWIETGDLEKAREELEMIREVAPDDVNVRYCDRILSGHSIRTDEHGGTFSPPRATHVAPQAQSEIGTPRRVLDMLLEAEDLPKTLEENRSILDTALLDLIRKEAAAANRDGDGELAAGLEALADYIVDLLA